MIWCNSLILISARTRDSNFDFKSIRVCGPLSVSMDRSYGRSMHFYTQNFVLTDLRCFWLLFTIWPQTRIPWLVGRRSSRIYAQLLCVFFYSKTRPQKWSDLASSPAATEQFRERARHLGNFIFSFSILKIRSIQSRSAEIFDGVGMAVTFELDSSNLCGLERYVELKTTFTLHCSSRCKNAWKKSSQPTGIPAPACGSKLFDT